MLLPKPAKQQKQHPQQKGPEKVEASMLRKAKNNPNKKKFKKKFPPKKDKMRKILGLFSLILFFSCNSSSGEEVIMNSVDNKWNKKSEQKFNLEISDPQNPKNIIFVVRNNNNYPYSNIRFIVNFTNLQNKKRTDTLNYVLAKPNGEWLGTGFGDTKETLFQYK
jgi:gliding motility-associated lipoprotein GldH